MALQPYHIIFPDSNEPIMTLSFDEKVGKIPKGMYGFVEFYCTDKGCDCRRVTIIVLNEKMKEKAVISFGFDPDGPMPGPFLDEFHRQSACAEDFLRHFVRQINENPDWVGSMYEKYRSVRKKIDGKPYSGRPFPKPGKVLRKATPPQDPELELDVLLQAALPPRTRPASGRRKQQAQNVSGDRKMSASQNQDRKRDEGMQLFVDLYARMDRGETFDAHARVQGELRRYLLSNDNACGELAGLLALFQPASAKDTDRLNAALRVLYDTLDIFRIDIERQRPGAHERMEAMQNALARRVFSGEADTDLRAAVSHVLLQSRIEILPVLRDTHGRTMMSEAAEADLRGMPDGDVMEGLFKSIEDLGVTSPFEGLEALLQLLALAPAEVQIALCGEMLAAANPFVRDTAALMLFHPDRQVRLGVSQKLVETEGAVITPETLRRMIVSRNWFPEAIRTNIDRAIANARKARVECAPLPKSPAMTVHASTVDGAGAQSFQVIVPEGKGFSSCSILLKLGVGIADAFVVPLKSKRELNGFLATLDSEAFFVESSVDYLNLRICQALADGASRDNAPNYWLVRIAEILGCDQWKAVPLDPLDELAMLRKELKHGNAHNLTDTARSEALEASAAWPQLQSFACSWFEDNIEVDLEIEKTASGKKKRIDRKEVVDRIVANVLEKCRSVWLDRLVLTALWLKSATRPAIPWTQMCHVAEAVADPKVPLRDIPLMTAVAENSFGAYLARKAESLR